MVCRYLVGRALGVVVILLVARVLACEGGCMLLGKRNGVSVGRNRGGAQFACESAPLPSCSPARLPARSWLFTCGVVGLWCGWRRLRR